MTPPGPRGPLLGRGFTIATDVSYATSRGQATLAPGYTTGGRSDTFSVTGTDDSGALGSLDGRFSPVDWLDVGGQCSLTGVGADVRAGRPALDDVPLAVSGAAGFETGNPGFLRDTSRRRSGWLRLEVYPRLPVTFHAWLVLAAGFNSGTFYHEIANRPPHVYESLHTLQLLRRESRVETSIGLFASSGNNRTRSVLLTVNPYFVVNAGDPTAPCEGCDRGVMSYRQNWGLVIVARFALHDAF